jgi:hypothetical protein
LHYRDWFQRLLDTGFTVAGKDARHQAAPQLLPTVTAAGGGASHPARSYGASWRSAESDESEQSPGARRASLPAAAFGVCGRLRPLASHARSGRDAGVRRRAIGSECSEPCRQRDPEQPRPVSEARRRELEIEEQRLTLRA